MAVLRQRELSEPIAEAPAIVAGVALGSPPMVLTTVLMMLLLQLMVGPF